MRDLGGTSKVPQVIAALSCISSQGLWILTDPKASSVVAHKSWEDSDSTGLSEGMARHFDALLQGRSISDLTHLFVVTGPGAFTGIRMSSAFVQGIARGRGIEAHSIPTFDLVGAPFFIPLRHQKAKDLSLKDSLAQGIEFLHIRSVKDFSVETPQESNNVLGLKDSPWPSTDSLLKGLQKNLASSAGIELIYGLEPKISGQRK